jgi:Family of unknown function (DUF6221)
MIRLLGRGYIADVRRKARNSTAPWEYVENMALRAPTLTDFLLARITEDAVAAHGTIAPRALAHCEAQRRLVELHVPCASSVVPGGTVCCTCGPRRSPFPCPALRLLASTYADHPDYRGEWRRSDPSDGDFRVHHALPEARSARHGSQGGSAGSSRGREDSRTMGSRACGLT